MTEILAFWGAILSTVAVAWTLILGFKDRGSLEVSGIVGKNARSPQEPFRFLLVITNIGRRPVLPQKILLAQNSNRKPIWRLLPSEGRFWRKALPGLKLLFRPQERRFRAVGSVLLFENPPGVLKEGEFHTDLFDDFSFIDNDLMAIFVTDSCGRKHEMSRERIKALLQQAEESGADPGNEQQGHEE